MKKNKKNRSIKEKLINILNSYKTIIYVSFAINIVLLLFCYYTISSNKVYTFSGSDEYLKVEDGMIVLNTDINILNGDNIKYINATDYDIISYKFGYYVMENDKLIEIVSSDMELETSVKISEIVNNFTSFNIIEKNKDVNHFTKYKKELLDNGLYLVLEAKTVDNESILSKVNLNISKVSKF